MIVAIRVCYYLIVITAACIGLVNTLQIRSHRKQIDSQGGRLTIIERVRDQITRNRIVRADETEIASVEALDDIALDHEQRIKALEARREQKEPAP